MILCPHCGAACDWIWGLGPRPSKRPVTLCEACKGLVDPASCRIPDGEVMDDDDEYAAF